MNILIGWNVTVSRSSFKERITNVKIQLYSNKCRRQILVQLTHQLQLIDASLYFSRKSSIHNTNVTRYLKKALSGSLIQPPTILLKVLCLTFLDATNLVSLAFHAPAPIPAFIPGWLPNTVHQHNVKTKFTFKPYISMNLNLLKQNNTCTRL